MYSSIFVKLGLDYFNGVDEWMKVFLFGGVGKYRFRIRAIKARTAGGGKSCAALHCTICLCVYLSI